MDERAYIIISDSAEVLNIICLDSSFTIKFTTMKFYYMNFSAPCRSVDMVIHMLNIPNVEYVNVNLLEREQLKLEFLKVNPSHTIPAIDDDGFILWQSQAICAYLVSAYGKDDSLYPKDVKKRAKVDEQLHYGNEFFGLFKLVSRRVLSEKTKFTEEERIKFLNVHDILEKILEERDYFGGDQLTIADFSFLSLLPSSTAIYSPIPEEKYPRLNAWMTRCIKSIPNYNTISGTGSEGLTEFLKDFLRSCEKCTAIKFYYMDLIPACRSVDMLVHMLNVPVEYVQVDLLAKDQLKPEFLKLNPSHTIPTIDDGGFVLWQSQAICAYLANTYGVNDSLYPKDPKKRAKVDEQLNYGNEFFALFKLITHRIIVEKTKLTAEEKTKILNVHDILEKILVDRQYFAGDQLTIADFSFLSLLPTTIEVYSPIPKDKYPRLNAWMAQCIKTIPKYDEVNGKGSEGITNMLKDILKDA